MLTPSICTDFSILKLEQNHQVCCNTTSYLKYKKNKLDTQKNKTGEISSKLVLKKKNDSPESVRVNLTLVRKDLSKTTRSKAVYCMGQ